MLHLNLWNLVVTRFRQMLVSYSNFYSSKKNFSRRIQYHLRRHRPVRFSPSRQHSPDVAHWKWRHRFRRHFRRRLRSAVRWSHSPESFTSQWSTAGQKLKWVLLPFVETVVHVALKWTTCGGRRNCRHKKTVKRGVVHIWNRWFKCNEQLRLSWHLLVIQRREGFGQCRWHMTTNPIYAILAALNLVLVHVVYWCCVHLCTEGFARVWKLYLFFDNLHDVQGFVFYEIIRVAVL